MREMSNEDIQKKLEEDGRTSTQYLRDWIFDLQDNAEESLGIYHLRKAIEALKKQVPKKTIDDEVDDQGYMRKINVCSICKNIYLCNKQPFCDNCGQKIDWSDKQ